MGQVDPCVGRTHRPVQVRHRPGTPTFWEEHVPVAGGQILAADRRERPRWEFARLDHRAQVLREDAWRLTAAQLWWEKLRVAPAGRRDPCSGGLCRAVAQVALRGLDVPQPFLGFCGLGASAGRRGALRQLEDGRVRFRFVGLLEFVVSNSASPGRGVGRNS